MSVGCYFPLTCTGISFRKSSLSGDPSGVGGDLAAPSSDPTTRAPLEPLPAPYRGRTGYNISNERKLQFFKQPFEIIHGQIAFKNTFQCVNKQTVVLLLRPVSGQGGRIFYF